MTADLHLQAYEIETVLYIALELSDAKWPVAFGEGNREINRSRALTPQDMGPYDRLWQVQPDAD